MNKQVINTDKYHLHISPIWNETGNMVHISISISAKEMMLFSIQSKEVLMRVLMILAEPTAGALQELKKLSKDIQLELCDNGKNLADESKQVGISETLRFLEKFKSFNIWNHIRETGYHELLPEKQLLTIF